MAPPALPEQPVQRQRAGPAPARPPLNPKRDRGPTALLIYDGGCGICTRLAAAAARFAEGRAIGFSAYQELSDRELTGLGISRARCRQRLRFRDAAGRFHGGAFAVNRFLLASAPPGWRGLAVRAVAVAPYLLPPLLAAELVTYEIVARNRRRGCRSASE